MARRQSKSGKTKTKKPTVAKRGRPSIYSEKIAAEICRRLHESDGDSLPESLRAICRDPKMPNMCTVLDWVSTKPEFAERYARARQLRKDALVDRLLSLAEKAKTAAYGEPGTGEAGARVAAYKLEIDALKWILSKEYARDYGDKLTQEISGPDGKPIKSETAHTLSEELQEAMLARTADAARVAATVEPPASFRGKEAE